MTSGGDKSLLTRRPLLGGALAARKQQQVWVTLPTWQPPYFQLFSSLCRPDGVSLGASELSCVLGGSRFKVVYIAMSSVASGDQSHNYLNLYI